MKTVYIQRGNDRFGPFQAADVRQLLNTGQLDREDLAWTEGLAGWEPLSRVSVNKRLDAVGHGLGAAGPYGSCHPFGLLPNFDRGQPLNLAIIQ